jgi:hypothetical protein
MRALYDKHNDMTFEDEEKAEAADMKEFMEGMMGEKIGDDAAEFESLEELMRASMTKMQEKAAAEEAQQASRQSKRKKSSAQTQAQAKAKAQAEDASGALRTIYRQLVSALHPDRETDPQVQLRKTALMKEANTAYEKRDLLALLQLQLHADLIDTSQLASMAKEKLAALTALLKERVMVLNRELFVIESGMAGEFDLPLFTTLSAVTLRRHRTEQIRHLYEEIETMKHDLALVQNDTRFKRWLREQDQLAEPDFDFDESDEFDSFDPLPLFR